MPGPWHITRAFKALEKKLGEIKDPRLKLGTIDTWIGWLFELRAEIEFREVYGKTKVSKPR